MKKFLIAISIVFIMFTSPIGAEESKQKIEVPGAKVGMSPVGALEPKLGEIQHKEDDVLLKFYDGNGEIISINWNGTVDYQGDLDYVSSKFWELMFKQVPQFCKRNMIEFDPKPSTPFEVMIRTKKGNISLKTDYARTTMSVVHLNTLDDSATKFWKAVEKAFLDSCK